MKTNLLFTILIIFNLNATAQFKLKDSSVLFGKWRITELRGNGWVWDVVKWKYKENLHKINVDTIENYPKNPSDVQNVGFDLLKGGKAYVLWGSGITGTHWWYNKKTNDVFTQQKCGTYGNPKSGWKPFVENSMLRLRFITMNLDIVMDRFYEKQ